VTYLEITGNLLSSVLLTISGYSAAYLVDYVFFFFQSYDKIYFQGLLSFFRSINNLLYNTKLKLNCR
jgi:hypothetical protein